MSNQINDEHLEAISAYLHEIVAMRHRFADYLAKFELWGMLTPEEQTFCNEIGLSVKKMVETKELKRPLNNQEKEELH